MIQLSEVKEGSNLESNNTKINLLHTMEFIRLSVFIRLSADFSADTLQARTEWHHILKVLKGKKKKIYQPRVPYSLKLSHKN